MATTDQLPVVDLRLLSHDDLLALSVSSYPIPPSSSSAPSLAAVDLPSPPIDRSIFNESAGSRKQTYSRLRISPHPPPPSSASSVPSVGNSGIDDNRVIISYLRQLFARDDPAFIEKAVVPVTKPAPQTPNGISKVEESKDKVAVSAAGAEVDLVALGEKLDPFAEELAKRIAGLKSEEEMLKFLGGLDGQWCSRRCRRRIVDAGVFGAHLPRGWKLLLALKRREGVPSLYCRRYVSPNGHHFSTCKEVSSYLLSLLGHRPAALASVQEAGGPTGVGAPGADNTVGSHDQNDSFITEKRTVFSMSFASLPQDVENQVPNGSDKPVVSESVNLQVNFEEKGAYPQPQLPTSQASSKRRKVSGPLGVAFVNKDGKFECPVCHKTFVQRARYIRHVGSHAQYQDLTPEMLLDESNIAKGNQTTSSTVPLLVPSHSQEASKLVQQNQDYCTSRHDTEFSNPSATAKNISLSVSKFPSQSKPSEDQHGGISSDIRALELPVRLNGSRVKENADNVNSEIANDYRVDVGDMPKGKGMEIANNATQTGSSTGAQADALKVVDGKTASKLITPISCNVDNNNTTRFEHPNNVRNQADNNLPAIIEEGPKKPLVGHEVSSKASCSKSDVIVAGKAVTNDSTRSGIAGSNSKDDGVASKNDVSAKLPSDAVPSTIGYAKNAACSFLNAPNQASSSVKYSGGSANDSIGDANSSGGFGSSDNDMIFDNNTKANSHSFGKGELHFEATGEINFASVSSAVGVANNCRQQTLERQSHLMGFSNDGSGFDLEAYNNELFSGTLSGDNVIQLDNSVSNSKADYSGCFSVSDINLASGPSNGNEQYESCTIDINANDSMIEELQKPDIELRDHFGGPDFGRDDLGTVGASRNIEDMMSFQVEFGLSSFVDSVNEAAMGTSRRSEKQCDLQLGFGGVKQEVMPNFQERKLFPPGPSQFVSGTGQNPSPMGFAEFARPKPTLMPNFEERRLFPAGPSQFVSMTGQNHTAGGFNAGTPSVFPNFEERRLFPPGPSQLVNMPGQHHPSAMAFSGGKQAVMPNFEERKLFPPGPSQFVGPTSHRPAPVHEPTLMLGYAPQFGNYPPIQFGWDLSSMQKMVGGYELVSVCVWCNREFRHAAVAEQQSDSVGLICPSCKERYRPN